MCDFKPGDEVVCVNAEGTDNLREDGEYVISRLLGSGWCAALGRRTYGVVIRGVEPNYGDQGFAADRFRKVERENDSLSIEAFLTIKPGQFEEPRRPKAPAKKRERAASGFYHIRFRPGEPI